MAKEHTQLTLAEAVDNKKTADAAYEALIRASKTKRTVAEAADHQKQCRTALGAKRYATAVIAAVKRNLPVPKKEDLVECRD